MHLFRRHPPRPKRSRTTPPRRRPHSRPGVERLEDRTVPTAILIHGQTGFIGANTTFFPGSFTDSTFTNQGTIDSDVSGGTITFNVASWTNTGTIQASNGGTILTAGTNTNFATGTRTGGTRKAFANGSTACFAWESSLVPAGEEDV